MSKILLTVPPYGTFKHPTLNMELENGCVLPLRITRWTDTGFDYQPEPIALDPFAGLPPGAIYKKVLRDEKGQLAGVAEYRVPFPPKVKRGATPPDRRTGRERSLGRRVSR